MEEDNSDNFGGFMDDNLGQPVVNLNEFCRHRLEEVLMLTEAVRESPFRGQAFQRLPKHMRRRQMSHHIKRLPKSIRPSSTSTSKDEMPPPPKRPSRKYRRRPRNLLLEYNRRQRSNIWLETHIWHSKRYSMMSKWGYKLPEKPSNKSFRACYRAATQHCFLSDISYFNCLELKGVEDKLLGGLQKCTSSDIGLTFAAKAFIDGSREGSVILFHPSSFPYKVIGRVSFIWKPHLEGEQLRTVWIFCHPSFYHEVVVMLKALFELNKSEAEECHHIANVAAGDKRENEGETGKGSAMENGNEAEGKNGKQEKTEKEEGEQKPNGNEKQDGKEKEKGNQKQDDGGKENGNENESENESENDNDSDIDNDNDSVNESDSEKEKEEEKVVKKGKDEEKDRDRDKEKEKRMKKKEKGLKRQNKEKMKLETKNIPFERTPKYRNADGSVTMTLLKDTINRFRLAGPLALSVIAEAFDVNVPVRPASQQQESSPGGGEKDKSLKRRRKNSLEDGAAKSAKKPKKSANEGEAGLSTKKKEEELWWSEYYTTEFHRNCLESQKKFYENLKKSMTPADVSPNLVFSLVVKDPRLTLPAKRLKSIPEGQNAGPSPSTSVDPLISHSPLWEFDIRDKVTFKKMSTSEINHIRSQLIVPGSDPGILLRDREARVPLIVIQRPGLIPADTLVDNPGSCNGFDILVPAGWGMPVWLSLIYRGARTGGLREMKGLILETNSLSDYHQPDSEGGELENLEASQTLKTLHFKYPPNNRPNFAKLGVQTPFYFPWKVLVRDWRLRSHPSEGKNSDVKYYVLRDRKKLSGLNSIFQNLYAMLKSQTKSPWVNIFKEEEMDCLIPVAVETKGKGSPKEHAMVCLPSVEDIRGLKTKGYTTPAEVLHADLNEETRKRLRLEHSKLLKTLKRKRKRCREKEREEDERKPTFEKLEGAGEEKEGGPSSKDAIEEYSKKVETLWLEDPEGIKSVIDSCSRTILGYVVLGNFSFTKARGVGLGYVTLRGLLFLLKRCYDGKSLPVVLYRNITSTKYRLGTLRLCTG